MEQAALNTDSPLSLARARTIVLDALSPIAGRERLALRTTLNRVLAEDAVAPFDVPAHDNSAMDGYALRAGDLAADAQTELLVVGTAMAGGAFSGVVGAGQAVRVMTGAVLPRGADAVVPQEDVTVADGHVRIAGALKAGAHVRRAGEDLAQGRTAVAAGTRIGPTELGLLASLGFAEITVRRPLRVAFFSTGDEVASLGKMLGPGEVYDINRYTLYGALTRLNADLFDMGVVRDDPQEMERALREAAQQADVILTTGGVSVGDADYVKEIVARLGQIRFWKIDIKPGRPMAFGRIGDAWLFGLPGNPVAVMVSFYQLVLDALLKLMGVHPLPQRISFPVASETAIRKMPGRREFPRGHLHYAGGTWRVRLAGNQGSGVLRSMAEANCFIVLPEERGSVAAGELVNVQLFESLA